MENYQQLATESFSYSWLIDRKPYPTDGNACEEEQSFDFDVPFSASPTSPVHADEIFFDGHIMPLYALTPAPPRASPVSWYSLRSPSVAKKNKTFLPDAWRKSSKRILHKCFGLVKPLYRRIKCSRKSNRVDDLERKVSEVNSIETSARPSSAFSAEVKKISIKGDLCCGMEEVKRRTNSPQASPCLSSSRSSDAERLIHEAILYCKRSKNELHRKKKRLQERIKEFQPSGHI